MKNFKKTLMQFLAVAFMVVPSFYGCQAEYEATEEDKTPADPDDGKDNIDSVIPSACFVSIIFGDSVIINNPFEAEGVSVVNNGGHIVVTSIMDSVYYSVSGKSEAGSLKFYSDSLLFINLEGLELTSDKGSAINVQSKSRTFLLLKDDTINKLTDAVSYTLSNTEDEKGAVFTEGPLVISGNGSLSVSAMYKHAICSDEYIRVQRGSIDVSSAPSDAIHSKSVLVEGGNINLKAKSNAIEAEAGYVHITGGTIKSYSCNDGIKASYTGTSTMIEPYIKISGGVIDVTTAEGLSAKAIQAETDIFITAGEITAVTSTTDSEGIDAGRDIVIDGGTINVNSYEDGINGKNSITINGGDIYSRSTSNDGIGTKSGTIKVTGGNIFAVAVNAAKKGFDFAKTSTFSITGGSLTGIGGSVNTPTSTQQDVLVCNIGGAERGEKIEIVSPEGEVISSFIVPADYSTMKMLFSTAGFEKIPGYNVTRGGVTIKTFTPNGNVVVLN